MEGYLPFFVLFGPWRTAAVTVLLALLLPGLILVGIIYGRP